MPFPYARLIVGKRHCRVLIVGNINSDATGIDIIHPIFDPRLLQEVENLIKLLHKQKQVHAYKQAYPIAFQSAD